MSSTDSELLERLRPFAACDVADALQAVKINGYLPDVLMWSPEYCAGTRRICGPAHTVQMVAVGGSPVPKLPQHHVDTVPKGAVVVISCPKVSGAVWGGLMSTRAQYLGAEGVVTDGRCRDLEEQRSLGFPVFASGISCYGMGGFVTPAAVNIPVVVAGVTVNAGDIIVGDLNGVVVVPREKLAEVVQAAERAKPIEDACMEDLKAGKTIQETFAKHRGK